MVNGDNGEPNRDGSSLITPIGTGVGADPRFGLNIAGDAAGVDATPGANVNDGDSCGAATPGIAPADNVGNAAPVDDGIPKPAAGIAPVDAEDGILKPAAGVAPANAGVGPANAGVAPAKAGVAPAKAGVAPGDAGAAGDDDGGEVGADGVPAAAGVEAVPGMVHRFSIQTVLLGHAEQDAVPAV